MNATSSFLPLLLITLLACNTEKKVNNEVISKYTKTDTFKTYTATSQLENQYDGFHSPSAINRIAEIENEYFNLSENSFSKYYGTIWKQLAIDTPHKGSTIFKDYLSEMDKIGIEPDSMHCTIYAMEAMKSGMQKDFNRLDEYHKKIWGNREYAGWSVGYILTKYFGWKAYLVISKDSQEYKACIKNYKRDRKYHVWKQPDIPLEGIFDFDDDKNQIDSLLRQNEFGWGFSNQGWHTWFTRFTELKECNWIGSPSNKYNSTTLFLSTNFTEYHDYKSHIVVFPPKKKILSQK